ncbi:hypothetical protein [Euzebya tangerina]|uniref:hypothetical protein n=1 Tax=Euzebya tangerina TaxID=591198 RepID=UPI0013C370B7|nr:hypothetical protein [Euzebya tangerina]
MSEPETAATPTASPEVVGAVNAVFAEYRVGVSQGDAQAVVSAISEDSIEDQDRIVELARSAPAEEVRALPAAEQLLVLTYRLNDELLDADDPFMALVSGGFAGQDRSLGELGRIIPVSDQSVLGVATEPGTGAETPRRWRFVNEADGWRFDLIEAQRLVSQAVATTASRNDTSVAQLVAATIEDLSGADAETVDALYEP